MKVLLILVLLMADGPPKETSLEMPTLDECWARAHAVIEKADLPKMQEAGVNGVGTGCIVIGAPSQDAGR